MTKTLTLSMRQIGALYGVSSHVVGKWLAELGLRDGGKPTAKAFQGGYCEQAPNGQNGKYYYVWNKKKTLQALKAAGHIFPGQETKEEQKPTGEAGRLLGPFSYRRCSTNGFEIVGSDGAVPVWVIGEKNAQDTVWLYNLAYRHGRLFG